MFGARFGVLCGVVWGLVWGCFFWLVLEYLCCFYLIVCYCAANQEKDKAEKAKNEAKNEQLQMIIDK